jgi:hypothetical protein
MKKIITTLLFLFLLFGCFAEDHEYNLEDITDYCMNAPGAKLPEIGKRIKIPGGFFSVEYVSIDGDGMDYLVKDASLKLFGYFSKLLYIYSENAQTHKTMADDYWPSIIIIQNDMEIENTGKTAPAIDAEGNRVEVPIFIGYGL